MKVRITLNNGEIWQGVVQTRDESRGKIVVRNPLFIPSGMKYSKPQTFFHNDIVNVEEIDDDDDDDDDDDEYDKKEDEEEEEEEEENERDKMKEAKKMETDKHFSQIHLIAFLNSTFKLAIKKIQSEKVIGLAVEGVLVGRRGRLCLLQIAAADSIFLFDMLHQAESFLSSGLKRILENPSILKVMHDCRKASDGFFHKYNCSLVNVYDTQVADILIRKRKCMGRIPRTVRSLFYCLQEYLKVSPEGLGISSQRLRTTQDDELPWMERPLTECFIEAAVNSVRYLKSLRKETIRQLLSEVEMGVDFYLKQIRDSRDEDVAVMVMEDVPEQFQIMFPNKSSTMQSHSKSTFHSRWTPASFDSR